MSALQNLLPMVLSHPLHRYIGVQDIDAADGNARIELTIDEHTVNPRGAFHGGVAYLLCDMACYAALLSVLSEGENAATHDLHVSMLRAAKLGERVVASAKVIKRGRNIAFMEATLHAGDKLLARATVTKSIIKDATPDA